jgi:hypothetical protein
MDSMHNGETMISSLNRRVPDLAINDRRVVNGYTLPGIDLFFVRNLAPTAATDARR